MLGKLCSYLLSGSFGIIYKFSKKKKSYISYYLFPQIVAVLTSFLVSLCVFKVLLVNLCFSLPQGAVLCGSFRC